MDLSELVIRDAERADERDIVDAIVELQDYERRLHDSRLPGARVAQAYFREITDRAADQGAILVAELEGALVGFVAGWVLTEESLTETEDSRRYGYVSDICVRGPWRGRAIAKSLLDALERRLAPFGVARMRINVLAQNASARASYEKAGFAPYEVMYEKRIPASRK